jgi:hypothetical protein
MNKKTNQFMYSRLSPYNLTHKYGHFREISASVFELEANVRERRINDIGKSSTEWRYVPVNIYKGSSVLKSFVMPNGKYRRFDQLQRPAIQEELTDS